MTFREIAGEILVLGGKVVKTPQETDFLTVMRLTTRKTTSFSLGDDFSFQLLSSWLSNSNWGLYKKRVANKNWNWFNLLAGLLVYRQDCSSECLCLHTVLHNFSGFCSIHCIQIKTVPDVPDTLFEHLCYRCESYTFCNFVWLSVLKRIFSERPKSWKYF